MYFHIFSSATLNDTFKAKYDGVLPRTPLARQRASPPLSYADSPPGG